jgi:hypothetical protein
VTTPVTAGEDILNKYDDLLPAETYCWYCKTEFCCQYGIIPDFLYSWSIIVGYFDMLVGVFATKENLETALALPYVIGWLSTLNNSRAT